MLKNNVRRAKWFNKAIGILKCLFFLMPIALLLVYSIDMCVNLNIL